MAKYFKPDGTVCAREDWLVENAKAERVVGYRIYRLGDACLEVYARYAGRSHGLDSGKDLIFELGITGNSKEAKHDAFRGQHTLQPDGASCLAAFTQACDAIEAAGGTEVDYVNATDQITIDRGELMTPIVVIPPGGLGGP